MYSFKPSSSKSSRYNSFDSRSSTQSHQSDPSSSTELPPQNKCFGGSGSASRRPAPDVTSRALVKAKSSDVAQVKVKHDQQNFTAMVNKFMEKRSTSNSKTKAAANCLIIPADFIAQDLKKTARKGSSFTNLHKKLFSKGSSASKRGDDSKLKALTEVKSNTRTLAMVLRSERELLSQNKDQESEIAELKLMLEEKNRQVDKLKDLCLNQREEIKSLKSAILFPDTMGPKIQDLLEKQGSELKQAKQLIPSLQRQVTSLTGKLHCLAEDLKEMDADKYPVKGCYGGVMSSPRTPPNDQEEATNSLEFTSGDQTIPGSPDDMFLKDFNPCLTPYYAKTSSKEFEGMGYDSPDDERLLGDNVQMWYMIDFDSHGRKLSKSSECCDYSNSGEMSSRAAHRSGENKFSYGKQMQRKLL